MNERTDNEKTSQDAPDRWSLLQDENARLRHALEVPAAWSAEECDGMEEAYRRASERHGHYESLFATVTWMLRYRAKIAEIDPK